MRIGILSAELGREDVHENKRLVREIRLKGHRARIINYQKTVVVTTKNKRYLYQPDKNGSLRRVNVDAVIPRINEADEQSINLASIALESLISSGVYSTANPNSIRMAKNKVSSLMALAGAGIPVPRTVAITGTEFYEIDVDKALKIVEPMPSKRLIVKTNTGTHGRGVMSANSRGEARAIVDGFLANNIPILLQQFVEPTKKDHYTDLRFIVVNGRVVASMRRISTRKDEIRANISLGGAGYAYKANAYEIELAERSARAVGLSVAGVDILPSGKQRVVIEVNASPGFVIEDVVRVNLARAIAQQAITGGRKNAKSTTKRIAEKLNTPIVIKPIAVPSKLKPLAKLKFPKQS
ncbi:MAG TPA: ATP-grasp domain-containing protein [Candidatus Binatia bacterium]|nr:ATP-grasp domain-containing protein [Candidatus Binatia bacterium]